MSLLIGQKKLGDTEQVLSWLLEEAQPVVRYHSLVDLLDRSVRGPDVKRTFSLIPKKGWAHDILKRQGPAGEWGPRKSLYRPKYTATNWMALVLSDFGLTRESGQISKTANLFLKEWMNEGEENIFEDEVCVVGNTARMLTRFGYYDDPRVRKLFERLFEDQKEDGGWHCWDPKHGSLDCWEALAAFSAVPKARRGRRMRSAIERGAQFYLERKLFDDGQSRYLPWFRLHYPVHYYYDILVGLDVITALGYGDDARLQPALEILNRKRLKGGVWPLERIHPDPPSFSWGKGNLRHKVKPFGLEEAGRPSKWITLTALRVLKRTETARNGQ